MAGEEGGAAGSAANSGEGGGVQATLFTQEQVNSIAAREKRGALGSFFKEQLGLDTVPDAETLKGVFAAADEHDKQKKGQQGDVERLTGELNSEKEKSAEVPNLKAQLLRQQVAGTMQLPVRFWKFVEGKTEDEIKESIEGLKKDLNLGDGDGGDGGEGDQGGQQQQSGTGARPPAPNPQQGRNNGGGTPSKTLSAGAEAYAKKHGKKE